ncbi:MAG: pyridoxal-phosphate dependent enzyme [Deltaproteobacteria bacterium]|nr:pyridoxal-phosphate dependent enzyme [Deltaproteobacteria bacterium]
MTRALPEEINEQVLEKTAARCRERGIIIPTFRQLENPETIPDSITRRLKGIGLWDLNPLNLFRITWKNDIENGLFGRVNRIEIPRALTGVDARIIGLLGKFFPTGAHKVGAAFGCLVPRLVSGAFDPTRHKAVWPSTGNYCRGGAFDCALLACPSVAILPKEMSRERFDWLREIGSEVIATPGCESNVKEIYDKCWELREDPSNIIFNQFDEFGNALFHYHVTGSAIIQLLKEELSAKERLTAFVSATGSAGTIAAGDFLKANVPGVKTIAAEALQCPTLLMNGFGGHRIEGIGDKHVPWIHNTRNTDAVAALDDSDCMRILRLFSEPEGKAYLESIGLDESLVENLPLLGISSIANLLAAIKTAKYFELKEQDVIITVFTDSSDMYRSRLEELTGKFGKYDRLQAAADLAGPLLHQEPSYFQELTYKDRKKLHNLKYFTWVEQQGKDVSELYEQWDPEYWRARFEDDIEEIDHRIEAFNKLAGWT